MKKDFITRAHGDKDSLFELVVIQWAFQKRQCSRKFHVILIDEQFKIGRQMIGLNTRE